MTADNPMIVAENASKLFLDGAVVAFRQLNLSIARNEKDKELRKNAIFWLGQSRDPRVVKFLLELIEK